MSHAQSTRRWPRQQVDLPVRIIALNGIRITPIPARGSAISRAGMALYALVAINPGDLMQLQFPTSTPSQVKAVVRNRTGKSFGLEFLTQLPLDSEASAHSSPPADSILEDSPELPKALRASCNPKTLYAGLRRKQEELRQVQKEIEALHMAIPLLTDEEEKRSRVSARRGLGLDGLKLDTLDPSARPWPSRS
jgi:hypothetical protein